MTPLSPLLALLRGERPAIEESEWLDLVELARAQGVLPILEQEIGSEAPLAVAVELERLHFERLAIAVLQERETIRLVRLLEGAGIDVLTFKGQVLSLEAYGQIGLREPADIDILVRPDDAARAAEAFLEDGFILDFELTPGEWQRVLRTDSSWVLRKGAILVDLHWELFSRTTAFPLPTADAFAEARAIEFGGAEVRTLSHDHLVLFLAIHGAKHFWERLEWLTSFAAIARTPDIDWDRVRALARQYGGTRRLEEAEEMAQGFGVLRFGFWEKSKAAGSPAGIPRSKTQDPKPKTQNRLTRLAAEARQFDHKRDALRAATIALFQPKLPDWRWLRLPPRLDWLYPIVRVLRLLSPSPRQQPQPGRVNEIRGEGRGEGK